MKTDFELIGVFFSVLICSILLFAFLQVMLQTNQASLSSRGQIVSGSTLEIDKSFIDWGTLYPDSSASQTINVKNAIPHSQTLSLATSAWNPANASDFLTLSWNYSGAVLSSEMPVELTLTVSPYIEGIENFTFNIIITGNRV